MGLQSSRLTCSTPALMRPAGPRAWPTSSGRPAQQADAIGSQITAGLARNLRRVLFEKVMRFSGAEFEHFSTASLITRATNDTTQVQTVMGIMVRMVFYAPIIGVGGASPDGANHALTIIAGASGAPS
ncbi:MAG: hypothetical protein IPH87_22625 [Anaerolineae bacterium]|nr:hypothetical protein [Anaerolineae bacterium]